MIDVHRDIRIANRISPVKLYPDQMRSDHVAFRFPADRKKIGKLSQNEKAEWYAHQFAQPVYPVELTTKDFARFWRWNYYLPVRIRRAFYRIKNFEIFKRYEHITVMKDKAKKHGI